MPVAAIVGAGPGLGLSLARTFGRHGHAVALLARDTARLEAAVTALGAEGITAAAFPVDVTDRPGLARALGRVAGELGPVDVLEYSPYTPRQAFTDVLDVEVEAHLAPNVETVLYGAVHAARTVLPAMLAAGTGTLLFTGGIGSISPLAALAPANAAQAALRNHVHNLHAALRPRGVHAAWVAVGAAITATPPPGWPAIAPDDLAAVHWELHRGRTEVERVVTGG